MVTFWLQASSLLRYSLIDLFQYRLDWLAN